MSGLGYSTWETEEENKHLTKADVKKFTFEIIAGCER